MLAWSRMVVVRALSSPPAKSARLLSVLTRTSLVLLLLLAAPQESHALTTLLSQSSACLGSSCEFAPNMFGPGASTSILRTYHQSSPGSTNFFLFQAEAGMTLFGYDHFSAYSRASGEANLVNGTPGIGGISSTGNAIATLRDVVSVPGPAGQGTLRLMWRVTGGVDAGWSTTDPLQTNTLAGVDLSFVCAASVGNTPLDCPDPRLQWTGVTGVDESVNVDVPIFFGQSVQYQLGIVLQASAGTGNLLSADTIAFLGHAVGDFSSTGVLVDVAVLDSLGNPLDKSGIRSESGFRYDLVSVPEPCTALLLSLGLVGLAVTRRSRV